jgi:hypothetical protein
MFIAHSESMGIHGKTHGNQPSMVRNHEIELNLASGDVRDVSRSIEASRCSRGGGL